MGIQSSGVGGFNIFPNSVRPMKTVKYNHSKSNYETFMKHHIITENRDKIRLRTISGRRAQINALTRLKLCE